MRIDYGKFRGAESSCRGWKFCQLSVGVIYGAAKKLPALANSKRRAKS
jgi:hypothetical protein